jgi:hypothetical protein
MDRYSLLARAHAEHLVGLVLALLVYSTEFVFYRAIPEILAEDLAVLIVDAVLLSCDAVLVP